MAKLVLATLALMLTAAAVVPSLGGSAQAADCKRVYTSSGWVTRC